MSASKTTKTLSRLLCTALLLGPAVAFADYELNLVQGVTEISHMQYNLHMIVLWICTVVGIGVFGVMIYSILNHRKSKGVTPATFHESTTVEVVWTVIPLIILVVISVFATKGLLMIESSKNPKPEVNIKVTGIQWKWEYDYIDDGFKFISALDQASEDARQLGANKPLPKNYLLEVDNPIIVPVDKKVRLLITANDVIHAWWIPALGVKRDAIPGFVNESWFKVTKEAWDKLEKDQDGAAVFRGQCAELCGKDHGFMPIVLKVVSQEAYAKWVATKKAAAGASAADDTKTFTMDELMKRGEEVYNKECLACHQAGGVGLPPTFPALKGSTVATGDKQGHIDIVVKGKAGMPPFARLSKADLAAVITFERNAWGNNKGDMVQPSEIK